MDITQIRFGGAAVASLLVFTLTTFAAQVASPTSAGATDVVQTAVEPIPTWVAWRVFHERLVYLRQQKSAQHMTQSLIKHFGLNPGQAANLVNGGDAFVRALERIDDEAKAEARKRYPEAVRSDPARSTVSQTRPVERPKSIRERAIADGLYADVEAKKAAALADHLTKLGRDIGGAKLQQITTHIQTGIASRIRSFAAPPPGAPTPGLPPGITRPIPTVR